MGVDFYCLSGYDKDGEIKPNTLSWHMNFSGKELLGGFHFCFGLDHEINEPFSKPCVMYYADEKDAKWTGNLIENLTDNAIKDFFYNGQWEDGFVANGQMLKPHMFFGGTAEDFLGWVREWQNFLLTCKGYSCPNEFQNRIYRNENV